MKIEDVAFGSQLSAEAGWNQLDGDWQRLLGDQPDGCFLAEIDGRPAGTVTTTCYGTQLAWIGMMLVAPEFRRQGIATALMEHAVQWLQQRGVMCIKLDATPAGVHVYRQLGFQAEWQFQRYARPATGATIHRGPGAEQEVDWTAVRHIDQQAFGVDRMVWLQRLASDSRCIVRGDGFAMLRPGRLAGYLGPVVATSRQAAHELIDQLVMAASGPLFWDVPGPNSTALSMAEEMGFSPVRELTRMWMGQQDIPGRLEWHWAIADPATG